MKNEEMKNGLIPFYFYDHYTSLKYNSVNIFLEVSDNVYHSLVKRLYPKVCNSLSVLLDLDRDKARLLYHIDVNGAYLSLDTTRYQKELIHEKGDFADQIYFTLDEEEIPLTEEEKESIDKAAEAYMKTFDLDTFIAFDKQDEREL